MESKESNILSGVNSFSAIFHPNFSAFDDPRAGFYFSGVLGCRVREMFYIENLEDNLGVKNVRAFLLAVACKKLNISPRFAKYDDHHLLYNLSPRVDEYDFVDLSGLNLSARATDYYHNIPNSTEPRKDFLSVQFEFVTSQKSLRKVITLVNKLRKQGYVIQVAHIDYEERKEKNLAARVKRF
jgi:hypothetical protein